MMNLSHSAFFYSQEKAAPSNPGIKHLALSLGGAFEMRSLCHGLMSASPARPRDYGGGLDPCQSQARYNTAEMLLQPAD